MADYHPSNSQLTDERLMERLQAEITGDLKVDITGIGDKAKKLLKKKKINSTYQLLSEYLLTRTGDASPAECAQNFYDLLENIGIDSHRATITQVVGEMVNLKFPGVYDSALYTD